MGETGEFAGDGCGDCAQREMPKYSCHKEVHALKIASVSLMPDGSGIIQPADPGYGPFRVNVAYMTKHGPQAGGYFVVYEDGYKSFSPAQAFEKGYTKI